MDLDSSDSSTFTPSSADLVQNVFNNYLILKVMMEKVENSTDLANYRLVNKETWTGLATQRLQMKNWDERKFLKLYSVEKVQEYCETFANAEVSQLSLFPCLRIRYLGVPTEELGARILSLETIARTFPQKIKSLDLIIGAGPCTPELLDPVLESQSSSLIELKINYSCLTLTFSPRQIYNSNYLLKNLRYLCLNAETSGFPSAFDAQCLTKILELICDKIPRGNPNSLKICLIAWNSPMAETVALLRKYELISSLKIQSLEAIRTGDCQILAESGVQLEFLRIEPLGEDLGLSHEICQFLQSQKNSLELLEWFGEYFEFPTTAMNLRKLRFHCITYFNGNADPEDEDDDDEYIPILYGKCFPKLEYLELSSNCDYLQPLPDFHSVFLAPQFPCVNLQILQLRYFRINADTINLISKIFPRIKKLDVGHYNDEEGFGPEDEQMFYSALWSANFASTLEEFAIDLDVDEREPRKRLFSQFELDSFYSGLNIDLIQQLDFSPGEYPQIQNPSILNFSKLRKLEIFALGHVKTPGACFTDFSAFALFGQLKNLEYLHVDEKVHEFTETAIQHMKQNHENNVRILTDDHSFTSTERIEKVFKTDWNGTKFFEEDNRRSFNLLV